jgi:hypothetical protein
MGERIAKRVLKLAVGRNCSQLHILQYSLNTSFAADSALFDSARDYDQQGEGDKSGWHMEGPALAWFYSHHLWLANQDNSGFRANEKEVAKEPSTRVIYRSGIRDGLNFCIGSLLGVINDVLPAKRWAGVSSFDYAPRYAAAEPLRTRTINSLTCALNRSACSR